MDFIDIISSLLALIVLEIVLGIDNLVFLAILTERLPREQRKKARRWGLTFAWVTRLLLLSAAFAAVNVTKPFLTVASINFSVRDLFFLGGGAFLIAKATQEIHQDVTGEIFAKTTVHSRFSTFIAVVFQVGLMDIIFSLDSVLTAVGLTSRYGVMVVAITCAIFVMIFASEIVSRFIEKYPTFKMLALCFLILIGMLLLADGFHFHIPRGYLYFAMAFSLGVELLNSFKSGRSKKRK